MGPPQTPQRRSPDSSRFFRGRRLISASCAISTRRAATRSARFFFHDAQVGRLGYQPLTFRIFSRYTFARRRVDDHPDPVPDEPALIEGVPQEPAAPAVVPADDVRGPKTAPRGRDALTVEAGRDGSRVLATGILGPDAPDDLRLLRDDLQPAGLAGDRAIPVAAPAGVPPLAHDAGHAAPRLVAQVFEKQRPEQRPHADLDGVGRPAVDCLDGDPGEPEPLVKAGEVLLIARKPIQRLDENRLETARLRRGDQLHKAIAPQDARAGSRPVAVFGDDLPAHALGVPSAKMKLILDRLIALQI